MFAQILGGMQSRRGEESAKLLGGTEDKAFKRRPSYISALSSPRLENCLQENGIKSLIFVGMSTPGCVLKTALSASDAEFVASVISDGCADSNQGWHEFLLGDVLNDRGYVAPSDEFKDGYERAQEKGSSSISLS
ncbi:Isochorismatase-like protein [Talaromyces proteolyticus]|uniref:Isochorismatase-like protein n=1 Tax=Talaromyces proteolyticus TaxID=1131652 RepID=A0AAD4KZ19_9EURO|nr:Isochorismatase-like protein [Talaromyces proteolyticus]KAH8702167.1 Isochorismatase-like protein [Talaromyces proteolyticus]